MNDHSHAHVRPASKSAAIFSRARAGDIHLDNRLARGENLVTSGCLVCGTEHQTFPTRLFRLAPPEWYVVGAAALVGPFFLAAAQSPDFLWYHSTSMQAAFQALVLVCTNWSITLPFVFLALVGLGGLAFMRAPKVTLCVSCDEVQATASRSLRVQMTVGSILVVLSTYLLLSGLKLSFAWASAIVIPVALLGIIYSRRFKADQRLVFHPATEGVVTVSGGVATSSILNREVPKVVAPRGPGRRWAAAAVASSLFGLTLTTMVVLTKDQVSCPPQTRMMDREANGHVEKWCEAPDGSWHGRYLLQDLSGHLEVIGGFNRSQPSGTWIDYRHSDRGVLVDEFDVHANINGFAPAFSPMVTSLEAYGD